MEKIFESLRELDKRAEDLFNLKNGLLMEHAAMGMAERIKTAVLPRYKGMLPFKLCAVREITAETDSH